ncbi:hypothetical protein B0H63DRAFT_455736 [Podospora didyma]|uniref:F-box domain-containing protein n=1 Tax=Podospora didyma TaxID=330526 RepID=A0AAE0K098_9PEZI|nr:hypothetical protein B0H63DRAFT_455736 [Podospora didyma]
MATNQSISQSHAGRGFSILDLPTEIQNQICSKLCNHCTDQYREFLLVGKSEAARANKNALLSLSLSCQSLGLLAQRTLHHDFTLNCQCKNNLYNTKFFHFVRTLAMRADLARSVKSLNINLHNVGFNFRPGGPGFVFTEPRVKSPFPLNDMQDLLILQERGREFRLTTPAGWIPPPSPPGSDGGFTVARMQQHPRQWPLVSGRRMFAVNLALCLAENVEYVHLANMPCLPTGMFEHFDSVPKDHILNNCLQRLHLLKVSTFTDNGHSGSASLSELASLLENRPNVRTLEVHSLSGPVLQLADYLKNISILDLFNVSYPATELWHLFSACERLKRLTFIQGRPKEPLTPVMEARMREICGPKAFGNSLLGPHTRKTLRQLYIEFPLRRNGKAVLDTSLSRMTGVRKLHLDGHALYNSEAPRYNGVGRPNEPLSERIPLNLEQLHLFNVGRESGLTEDGLNEILKAKKNGQFPKLWKITLKRFSIWGIKYGAATVDFSHMLLSFYDAGIVLEPLEDDEPVPEMMERVQKRLGLFHDE